MEDSVIKDIAIVLCKNNRNISIFSTLSHFKLYKTVNPKNDSNITSWNSVRLVSRSVCDLSKENEVVRQEHVLMPGPESSVLLVQHASFVIPHVKLAQCFQKYSVCMDTRGFHGN